MGKVHYNLARSGENLRKTLTGMEEKYRNNTKTNRSAGKVFAELFSDRNLNT